MFYNNSVFRRAIYSIMFATMTILKQHFQLDPRNTNTIMLSLKADVAQQHTSRITTCHGLASISQNETPFEYVL